MTHKHLVCLICIFSCVMVLGGVWPAYAQGAQPVQVRVAPAAAQVYVGQTVDVAVEVIDVEALYGNVALTFDQRGPGGGRRPQPGRGAGRFRCLSGARLSGINRADNTAGTVRFAMTQQPAPFAGGIDLDRLRGKVGGARHHADRS
jgi:hypothetical protein